MIPTAIVVRTVARHFAVAEQDITGPRRFKTLSLARTAAAVCLRIVCRLSWSETALALRRDHSTLIQNLNRFRLLAYDEPWLRDRVVAVVAELKDSAGATDQEDWAERLVDEALKPD